MYRSLGFHFPAVSSGLERGDIPGDVLVPPQAETVGPSEGCITRSYLLLVWDFLFHGQNSGGKPEVTSHSAFSHILLSLPVYVSASVPQIELLKGRSHPFNSPSPSRHETDVHEHEGV